MAYTTIDDIKKKIGGRIYNDLTMLVEGDPEGLTADQKAEQAITDAETLINAYIREAVKTIPPVPVPNLIQQYARDLAICELYMNQPESIPEQWKSRKPEIMKSLKDISEGTAVLDTGPESTDESTVRTKYGSNPPKLTRTFP